MIHIIPSRHGPSEDRACEDRLRGRATSHRLRCQLAPVRRRALSENVPWRATGRAAEFISSARNLAALRSEDGEGG